MANLKAWIRRTARNALFRASPEMKHQLKLGRYAETLVEPTGLDQEDLTTYVPTDRVGHAGIDLRVEEQLERLDAWRRYQEFFRRLRADARINTHHAGQDHVSNDFYPTPDAEVYASMIFDFEPTSILEIGGGFSTHIAKASIAEMDRPCRLNVVDPEPRTDVAEVADTVVRRPIEDVDTAELPIDERTLFFIDSSHITRARGDIPHLFNRIVPELPSGTLVHVHDIFLPYDYPFRYQSRLFTEQYVLQALLSGSDRYTVMFATHFMSQQHPERMQAALGSSVVGADHEHYGGSLWFRIDG